jgi:peptidoglycan/xylan/chitin deacetylase (PgdA/CDA1 family)
MTDELKLPFDYSALPERSKWRWPNAAGLAAWVVINIEHFEFGKLGTAIQPHLTSQPEIANYAWRDYGNRIGIWRLFDLFDRYPEVKVTVALNADICHYYPQIVEAALARNWEIMGHGLNNSTSLAGLDETTECHKLTESLSIIQATTGQLPRGWLSPGFSVTMRTPDLLRQAGVRYLADWVNDDQPYFIKTQTGPLVAVPYTLEANDITLCLSNRFSGPEFSQAVCDQFDQLLADSVEVSRVFVLGLHPFIVGQPLRLRYLEEILQHLSEVAVQQVWLSTGYQIADHFAKLHGESLDS